MGRWPQHLSCRGSREKPQGHSIEMPQDTGIRTASWLVGCFGFGCRRQQKRHAAAPTPAAVRRRMERTRQKLVGRDKGSLTETANRGKTGTTTIQIRRKNDKNRPAPSDCTGAARSRAAREFPPRRPPPEPSMTAHGMEYPALFGQVGVGSAHPAVPLPGFW